MFFTAALQLLTELHTCYVTADFQLLTDTKLTDFLRV